MVAKSQRTISGGRPPKHHLHTTNAKWSGAMTRTVIAEAREIFVLMSMLAGLSVMSLAVACGAVIVADSQTQEVAALAMPSPLASPSR
jgi:hypothetical protein